MFKGSWKTTSAGITMVVGGIVGIYFSIKNGTFNEAVATTSLGGILGGIGLICARDNDKSSEDVGTK